MFESISLRFDEFRLVEEVLDAKYVFQNLLIKIDILKQFSVNKKTIATSRVFSRFKVLKVWFERRLIYFICGNHGFDAKATATLSSSNFKVREIKFFSF